MIGPSVMFVDDEPQMLAALVRVFRDDPDLNIFVARDGLDALRKLERNRIDLVVTDFRMPGLNGAELLDEVARRYPRTKGAILSAYPELALGLRGLDGRQRRPFFYKPWDIKTFHQAIRKLLLLPPNTPLPKLLSGSRN